ncbi:MAG: hypothetical protein AAB500_01305 [Patescibacteria group bacterium]
MMFKPDTPPEGKRMERRLRPGKCPIHGEVAFLDGECIKCNPRDGSEHFLSEPSIESSPLTRRSRVDFHEQQLPRGDRSDAA